MGDEAFNESILTDKLSKLNSSQQSIECIFLLSMLSFKFQICIFIIIYYTVYLVGITLTGCILYHSASIVEEWGSIIGHLLFPFISHIGNVIYFSLKHLLSFVPLVHFSP